MKRVFPILFLIVMGFGVCGFLFSRIKASSTLVVPTAMVLATEEPGDTATPTATATATATITPTQSATATATATRTPTPTKTLATLIMRLTAVNHDVTLQPVGVVVASQTATALPTVNVPPPPVKVVMAIASEVPAEVVGWYERDITDVAIQKQGKWDTFTTTYRSANKRYLYSDDDNARLTLRFLGAAVRVRYVAYYSYGVFQVILDEQVVATIDSYYAKQSDERGNFLSTDVFGLAHGWHTLQIVRMGRKNPDSKGALIALDAIDIYPNAP